MTSWTSCHLTGSLTLFGLVTRGRLFDRSVVGQEVVSSGPEQIFLCSLLLWYLYVLERLADVWIHIKIAVYAKTNKRIV